MVLTYIPPKNQLQDKEILQIEGPDNLFTQFLYDANQNALYTLESSLANQAQQTPNATCDTDGLMAANDKCKLDALVQMRLGVAGFQGAGFVDDGGWLGGDIILAAGSEFINLERIGNVIRFTVDSIVPFCQNCEECLQLYWVQDETSPRAIRPPTCSGKLPDVDLYGQFQVFTFPESTIVDPANAAAALNNKGLYPAFIFKRYQNSITPGLGEIDVILQRNATNQTQTQVGWTMTPGPAGVAQCEWAMGLDADGNQITFDLNVAPIPGLLGGLLYNGNLITKQMAVVVDYTSTTLTNNLYKIKLWDVLTGTPLGDTLTATNVWRYDNPLGPPSGTGAKTLTLDVVQDILPIGTLVDIWTFTIGEVSGNVVSRNFFSKQPPPNPNNLWTMVGAVQFGDTVQSRYEVTPGGSGAQDAAVESVEFDDFEKTIWGLDGYTDPLVLLSVEESAGTGPGVDYGQHRAIIDATVPGLVIQSDSGPSQRPVRLWNRVGLNSMLIRAEIAAPTSYGFPPYDILLGAPIDNRPNLYLRVATVGNFGGLPGITVDGAEFSELPRSGALRILTPGAFKGLVWRYDDKFAFPPGQDQSVALASSVAHHIVYPGRVGDVVELLHKDFTAPCLRLQFSGTGGSFPVVNLQAMVGMLGMDTPYHDSHEAFDNVRGLQPGYAVSSEYSQFGVWDGTGARPSTNIEGFAVIVGGFGSDAQEHWNVLEVMVRGTQVWVWWNGLLLPPSSALSAALSAPVVVNTPYFVIPAAPNYGKMGLRLWPGAVVRRVEVRTQQRQFSEFFPYAGQLVLA